jgi:hypothetical protein
MPANDTSNEPFKIALSEKKNRLYDALRLFRPLETQVPVIATRASEVVVRGGNRSGKSVLAATIVASAARRKNIIGTDNKPLPAFSPQNRPLTIWVIGKGEKHIGDTLYRLLFAPGQIPILKDPRTGQVRAARNWEERVLGQKQGLISSPLIPGLDVNGNPTDFGEVASVSWKDKGERHFSTIIMKNGTTIHAFTSTGDVKMGDPVDLIWIDEDLFYPKYVAEWQARLSDRKGRILWSAWPWASNFALVEMSNRAKEQRTLPNPDVFEAVLKFSANPLIDEDEKRKRRAGWSFSGNAELRSRDEGDFVTDLVLMYPNYAPSVHGIGDDGLDDNLSKLLAKTGFVPPPTWTRRMFIDPGHSTTAVLFVATPPPEIGDHVIAYDELYLHGYGVDELALAIHEKIAGQIMYEWVFDNQLGQQSITGMGGLTFYDLYAQAFQRANLRTVVNEYGFTIAAPDEAAGHMAVRRWLTIRSNGTTKFRSVLRATPNLQREVTSLRKRVTKEEIEEKSAGGQPDHLCDDLRYAAMHGCEYVPIDLALSSPPDAVYKFFKNEWQGNSAAPPTTTISCGPGALSPAA